MREGAVIHAPAKRLLVHEAMEGYEPRRFVPGSENGWPHVQAIGGGTLDASLVPAYGEEQAQEMAYLTDLTDGWYAITNPAHQVGFGLSFDKDLYRYIWYWQQLGDVAQGYPWWGRLHTMALEPWTSYPTNGLAASGREWDGAAAPTGRDRRNTALRGGVQRHQPCVECLRNRRSRGGINQGLS